jgi:iron complex transport system permease protein
MKKNLKNKIFLFLVIFLILIFFFCLSVGTGKVPLHEEIYTLLHPHHSSTYQIIIWKIRIPRILLGMIVGAGLAASGCVFQGLLRNPLADPYTLGVSGGAAFGVTLGTISGLSKFFGFYWIPICAFLGALLSIFLVYLVASKKYFSIPGLILGGVILGFLFSSLVLLIFAITETNKIHSIIRWLMGDLSSTEIGLIKVIALFVFTGIFLLFLFSRHIDVLTLGDEKATYLGVEIKQTKKMLFVITSLITGACVAGGGIVGFVGLLIPHIMRQFTGPTHKFLIPASILSGAIFLVLADTLARTIIAPVELPVGVITGILGGSFLLVFLLKTKKWEIF